MYEILIGVGIVIWISCGIISYGYHFGYFQRKFPSLAIEDYKKDMCFSILVGIFGPYSLVILIILGNYKCGIKFK